VIFPGISCPQSLGRLSLAVLLEEFEDRGALECELALALALPKDDTSTQALRAFVGVSNAIRPTRTLVADVTLPRAVWFAGRKVPVLLAALLARSPVPLLAARVRVATAMSPGGALDLEPCPYYAGLQVHIRPAKTQCFALADAKSKRDRPASAVSLGSCHIQDSASLLSG
jgi:hypothetical protein